MKKITSLLLTLLLVLTIACLASCESAAPAEGGTETESAAPTDTDEALTDTESAPSTEGDTESETAPAPIGDGLALDTVSEEFDSTMIGGKFTTKSYKYIKSNLFKSSTTGFKYNWYEFYNACVTGVLDITDAECLSYAEECLAFFNENELPDEAAQATALIGAAK